MQIITLSGSAATNPDRQINKEYKHLLIDYADIVEQQTDFGSVIQQHYAGPDFHIGRSFTFIQKPSELQIKFERPMLMLSYLLDGEIAYLDKGLPDNSPVKAGRYHLSYENTSLYHISFGEGYLEYLNISLSERYFDHMDIAKAQIGQLLEAARQKSDQPLHSPFYKITARIRKIVREILSYRGEHVNLYIQAKINELLLQFLESTVRKDFPEPVFNSDQQKLKSVTDYIEKNLEKSLAVETLAKRFGYSGASLHKKFRQCFEITLYQYILEQRMLKARKLLTGKVYYSVATIALQCGYSDSSNFLSAFKKRFSRNTSHYRMVAKRIWKEGIHT